MNTRTKVILLIGLLPIIAVTAFPPRVGFNGTGYMPIDGRPLLFSIESSGTVPDLSRILLEYILIASITAVALLVSGLLDKRPARLRAGLCVKCGYDLRETPNRCPECGAVPEGARDT